jgi:hypothetical protein
MDSLGQRFRPGHLRAQPSSLAASRRTGFPSAWSCRRASGRTATCLGGRSRRAGHEAPEAAGARRTTVNGATRIDLQSVVWNRRLLSAPAIFRNVHLSPTGVQGRSSVPGADSGTVAGGHQGIRSAVRFFNVSSGLAATPSVRRFNCASVIVCVVTGSDTRSSSGVPGAI